MDDRKVFTCGWKNVLKEPVQLDYVIELFGLHTYTYSTGTFTRTGVQDHIRLSTKLGGGGVDSSHTLTTF